MAEGDALKSTTNSGGTGILPVSDTVPANSPSPKTSGLIQGGDTNDHNYISGISSDEKASVGGTGILPVVTSDTNSLSSWLDKDVSREGVPTAAVISKLFSSTIIVIGLILLTVLTLKKFWGVNRRNIGDKILQPLEVAAIGPKRTIHLVQVADKMLILGSSESGIQLLTELDLPEAKMDTDFAPVGLSSLMRRQGDVKRDSTKECSQRIKGDSE